MWQRVVRFYVEIASRLGELGRGADSAEEGQSMVEYAIVAALIAVVAMVAVQALGTGISGVFMAILGKIQNLGA